MSADPKVIEIPGGYSRVEDREASAVQPWQASPMAVLATAVQRGMDPATLKDLRELVEWNDKREAEKAFNQAFADFKAEAITITKNKDVTAGPLAGKSYAELIAWVGAVTPALSKHGLAASWRLTKDEPQWIEVTCTLAHVKGHSHAVSMGGPPDVGGAKSAIQARASTVTYLERYTLKAITGLAESGDDNDGAGGSTLSVEEIAKWVKAIEATTTKPAAKEKCLEALAAAEALNDLAAYQTFKDTLKKHGEFIDQTSK
jgi:hypothetical protein